MDTQEKMEFTSFRWLALNLNLLLGLNLMFVKNIVPLLGLKNWRRYVVPDWHTEF